MGKQKKKVKESVDPTPLKKISNQLRNKINPLVQKLLSKCTTNNVNPRKEMEEYKEIFQILQQIRDLEKDHVISLPVRENHWAAFEKWCVENGASLSSLSIKESTAGNFGIFAGSDLEENSMFLSVPRKLMMSVDAAKESLLGPLLSEDPMLKAMPNVVLSVYLISEYLNKDSFWKPYLAILPSSYHTILYYDMEDLMLLQGSPTLAQVINICRSVARQYAYFQQLFQNNAYAMNLDIGHYFTYDLYRWAVSTVMTRQNSIPTVDTQSVTTALVPLWDMCNHANGKFSTDFNVEKDCIEAYSMKDFAKDEEVNIFYGLRSNSEFFIHNAFVYPDNAYDWMTLQLSISKSDPLASEKTKFCLNKGISLSGKFQLKKQDIVPAELLTFLKINVLKEDEVKKILNDSDLLESYVQNDDVKQRALTFLKDRANLLLKCYKSSIEEDEKVLQSTTSERKRMAIDLRISEKKLLTDCIQFCSTI